MKNSNHTELRSRARNAANRFERTRTRNAMAAVALAMGTLACGMSATAIAQARAPEVEATTNTSALADGLTRQDQGHTDRLIVRMKRPMVASGPQHAATGKAPAEAAVATRALLGAQTEQRRALTARLQSRTPETLTPHRTMGDGSHVLRLNRRLPPDQIRAIAARLAQDPDVLDVLPDRVFYPALTPTDPRYATDQWYLSATNGISMPGAWDITTGSPSLVIGLIDTGLLPHNDLAGRTVPGYDFVSLTARENDTATQPGRDNDPTDPGDACLGTDTASWHGTTMAGVIAANANNGGIVGINWQSKILPVRAVGKCGGYESDIVDALRWAVGIAVAGVPANANPAKVINMSLAASSPAATGGCASNVTPPNTTPLQTAISEVLALNVPVIAAAGNSTGGQSTFAADYAPGNCAGVITVGAVDKNGGKPTYANTGTIVTVSAPGGSGVTTCNADPLNACHSAANIVTTHNAGAMTADSNYDYLKATSGTSIAAAMVTGVVSLMRGINPQLTPNEIKEIIKNTSRAFPTGTTSVMPGPSQADCTNALCGKGIVAAGDAVGGANRWGRTTPQLSGGAIVSLGLRSDGAVFGWGINNMGTLGNGGTTDQFTFTQPSQTVISGVTRISVGNKHALGLRADGTVWFWGNDGLTAQSVTPRIMEGLSGITGIGTGQYHSFAIANDGSVWVWGEVTVGGLGLGDGLVPAKIPGMTGVTQALGGLNFSLARKSDGTVWSWGQSGAYGQLGRGLITGEALPGQIPGLSGVTALATKDNHVLALKADGTVWAWGSGNNGELGIGGGGDRNVPVQIPTLSGIVAIAAGSGHSLALKGDGTVWAWGKNDYGQIGDGGPAQPRYVPVQLALSDVVSIAAGIHHSLALKSDGTVWMWGDYSSPLPTVQLGVGGMNLLNLDLNAVSFVPFTNVPVGSLQTSNTIAITGIPAGSAITVVGGEYRIDAGPFTNIAGSLNPGQQVTLRQTASASCNTTTSAVLTIAGVPRSFNVRTAPCDTTPDPLPAFISQFDVPLGATRTSNAITITGINTAVPISISGGEYSIGCTASFTSAAGTIGPNQSVCIRLVASSSYNVAVTATLTVSTLSRLFSVSTAVPPGFTITPQLSGGAIVSLGLRSDGAVFGWGINNMGTLGNGGTTDQFTFTQPSQTVISGVTRISVGNKHALGLRADGTVWFWGNDGLTAQSVTPRIMEGLSGITGIGTGQYHSFAIANDGSVWVWGEVTVGGLGLGDGLVPAKIPGMTGVTQALGGLNFSLARKSDGTVWSWGQSGAYGQLGRGLITGEALPGQIPGLSGVTALATKDNHVLALKADGTVWAWGSGNNGELGIGGGGDRNVPVQIPTLSGIVAIAAGSGHSLALKGDGTVWAWGKNDYGQIGDGGPAQPRYVPVQLALSDVVSIAAGIHHSLALKSDGTVWMWGDYSSPLPTVQLGVGGMNLLNLDLNAVSFVPFTNVPVGSLQTSNTIAITGIPAGSAITVVGGEYRIDAGPFTNIAGSLNPGQQVTLRQTASASCNTTTSAVLTIAGVPRSFNVRTAPCDTTPDPLPAFISQFDVPLGATRTSNAITITGINTAVPISISGGEYSIGCTASFTSAAGTIGPNQSVCIRLVASSSYNVAVTATLTVSTLSRLFSVSTAVPPGFTITPQLSGGAIVSLGLRSDGAVFGWGINNMGTLGNGGTTDQFTFTQPSQTVISGVTRISVGNKHALGLRADGTVWFWGNDGLTAQSVTPRIMEGLSGITGIGTGQYHSFAIANDGSVWVWGEVTVGGLGLGDGLVPAKIPGMTGVTQALGGLNFSLARKSDGTVWSWGQSGAYGQLGRGLITGEALPGQIPGLSGVTALATKDNHVLALKADGTVWAWGSGNNGELGIGGGGDRNVPVQIPTLSGIVAIAAGSGHSLALKGDGTVWAWGKNDYGQIGDGGPAQPRYVPVQLALSDVVSIAAGIHHSLALKSDGTVWMWGDYSSPLPTAQASYAPNEDFLRLSEFGTRPNQFPFNPVFGAIPSSEVASASVSVGGLATNVSSSMTITGGTYSINNAPFTSAPGTVVNGDTVIVRVQSSPNFATTTSATLTIGGTSGRSSTFYVRTRNDPTARAIIPQVALGNSHSYVLSSNGTVYAVGYNGNGQLGNGTTFSTPLLRPVAGLGKITAIAAGANHGLALRDDRTITAWGYNAGGQLGSGADTNSERYFVNVSGLTDIIAIAAGEYHSLALKQDGTVWAWGLNVDGQIGQGNTTTSRYLAPVQVKGIGGTGFLTSVTAIAAGNRHNLAVLIDGSVVAWGANTSGQLGNNSTIATSSPITISGLTNIVALAAGGNHSLAIKNDASLLAWGDNAFGQLGVGDIANRHTPVAIPGLTQIGRIAAGATHSLAVKTGGALYTWGNNANRQLDFAESANPNVTPSPNRTSPQLVSSVPNVFAISAGGRHSAAQRANGELRLWGDNFFGQLGNKSGNFNPHSAALNVLRGDSQISGFGGSATSSSGATSTSGSAVIDIAGLATDYDFGDRVQGSPTTISGSFKNQALTGDITAVGINVVNTGGSAYSLQTNTCGATLPAGMECSFTVAFNPNTAGDLTGRLEVASSLIGSPEVRQLFGKGIAPASPGLRLTSTGNLNYFLFEPQTVGTQSTTRPLTIANTGNATLNVSSITLTNGQNDFTVVNPTACASVAAGMSCNLDLKFNPIAPNAPNIRSGLVSIATNAGTQTVALEGAAAPSDAVVSGLMLIGAMSRKDHGTAQTPNLQPLIIDRTKTINQAISIEPRSIGSGHQIVFQFNGAITNPGTATLTDKDGQPITTAQVTTASNNNDVIVTIANLPDATRVTINLTNVNGTSAAISSIALGFLVGDINGSGKVTGADIAGIKARQSGSVTSSNYKADINVSGAINNVDVSAVKARAGARLP